jgi:chromate transporter
MRKVRYIIFLKDVLQLSITSFGGPQAHLGLFHKILVEKRRYLQATELLELSSFCNILPGPASTQTITAVGFKIGGSLLAFLTLLVWTLPVTLVMIAAALSIEHLNGALDVARFIQPMAISFVAYAVVRIAKTAVHTKTAVVLFVVSTLLCYSINYPGIFPLVLIVSGLITALKFKRLPKEEEEPWKIEWGNFVLYASIFIGAALFGHFLDYKPIKLFENFFRNGSYIFGGGQPLSGLLFKEFVEFKQYLSEKEFMAGYALQQALPGPLFSFSAFVGSLSLREYSIWGQILGGFIASVGIYLPGTLMIFFVVRFWDKLKKYRAVKASLEGVNAASGGIILATACQLIQPVLTDPIEVIVVNFLIFLITLLLLIYTKIPPPYFILAGLLIGFLFKL